MVIYGTVSKEQGHICLHGCFNPPDRCYFNIARPDQQRPDGGAAMGGSLRSSLAGCAHLPIHIAMGGYASHGRTSVRFEVTGCW